MNERQALLLGRLLATAVVITSAPSLFADPPFRQRRPDAAVKPSDSARLQGRWQVIALFRDGKRSPGHDGYEAILIGPNHDFMYSNVTWIAKPLSYRIDSRREPKHFDIYNERGDELICKAIYKFQDGQLWLCEASRPGNRPATFDTKPNDGRMLFITMAVCSLF